MESRKENGESSEHGRRHGALRPVAVVINALFLLIVLLMFADTCEPAFASDMCPSDVLIPLTLIAWVFADVVLGLIALMRASR